MRARKVYRIYATLPDDERASFGRYLASPYFNTSQRLVDFRQLLEDALVQQPELDLSAEQVWQQLPGVKTEFRANGFDKLCAELLAALNDFLAQEELRHRPYESARLQMEAYVNRHLDDWVPGLFAALIDRWGTELERDAEGLWAHAQILEAFGVYVFRQPRQPRGEILERIDAKLNEAYLAKKLEIAALVDLYNRTFSQTIRVPFMDFVEAAALGDHPMPTLLKLRSLAWQLNHHRADTAYWQLKAGLLEAQEIDPVVAHTLFHQLLNFAYLRMNEDDAQWEAEAAAIQLDLLARRMLHMGDHILPSHLKNVVQLQLAMGEVAWVRTFLAEAAGRIEGDVDGLAATYNEAVLALFEGRHRDCFQGMERVLRDFKEDVYYVIDARVYQLMALYELGAEEDRFAEFEARHNALRVSLVRESRVSALFKERYQNLVKQFRRLHSLRQEQPAAQRALAQKFIQNLSTTKPASNRRWFERQARLFLD
jgi:hypothetical protein